MIHDVIIVGAGPSGSTAANLLAQKGHDILVLERDAFPRFRIGESLLPCDLPIFERLGFVPTEAEYVRKAGASFYDDRTGKTSTFNFAAGLPGTPPYAWQVDRAKFDNALLDCAKNAGAKAIHGVRATEATFDHDGVSVAIEGEASPRRARYLIDATGPRAFMGKHKQAIEPIRGFGNAAVFAHFTQIDPALYASHFPDGSITVLIEDFGWGWVIPLVGGRLSVGFVTNQRNVSPELHRETVKNSRYLAPLLKGAVGSEPQMVGNFSFINREPCGVRYACVGDAAAFLDPVFSSGVSLGMLGAELTADRLTKALTAGTEADPELMADVRVHMQRAYESFGSFIWRFYNTKIVDNVLFSEDPDPAIRAGIVSLLAGDVWRDDNPFQESILKSRMAWRYGANHDETPSL